MLFKQYKCDIVLGQENTDNDPLFNSPVGVKFYRPKVAQSNVIYWNTKTVLPVDNEGAFRLSSPEFKTTRFLVYKTFEKSGKRATVASIHLPAFYTSSEKNRAEYNKQVTKVANWFKGDPLILGGDFNGNIAAPRLEPLRPLGRWSKPVPSSSNGFAIDYVGSSVKSRWWPVATQTHNPENSDHKAVIVTFEWR